MQTRARPYSRPMDTPDTPVAELRPTLDRLRTAWQHNRPDARQRMDDLARLRDAFKAGRGSMLAAIGADFGHRSAHETLLSDAMTVPAAIDHLRGKLRGWMKPRRAPRPRTRARRDRRGLRPPRRARDPALRRADRHRRARPPARQAARLDEPAPRGQRLAPVAGARAGAA